MASGRAAYVLGDAGGDGWVTADTYPALEADGFSGRALGHAIGLERLAADLTRWREEMGEVGRDLACTHHDATDHVEALLELVHDLGAAGPRPPEVPDELQRLIRLEWERNMQARSAAAETAIARAETAQVRAEVSALRGEVRAVRTELGAAQKRGAELEDRLRELTQTRRYRWASRLAAPVDRLRSR
jgi:chromosome segregation ATPase